MRGAPATIAVDLRALVPEATGIGVYTRELLAALAARPGAPRYLGMAHRTSPGVGALADDGVDVEIQRAPLGSLWQQLHLPRRLARGDVDLLFSPIFTLPLACPVPGVVTVPDLTVYEVGAHHTLKVRLSIRFFLRRSLRRARRVIVISESTRSDLLDRYPWCAGKTEVIYPGVASRFRPAGVDAVAAIRAAEGAPGGYLLYVGTMEPRKNVDRLLAAWARLRRADPAFPPLLIAGAAGWHSDHTRSEIERLAPLGVRHLGRVDDARLLRLYQGALAFAYPSLYEGFGLPVAEALACGVPTLTSNRSSLPEVAGDAALTVDPGNEEEIAEGLKRLVGDEGWRRELAAKGVERAKGFSWEKAAGETEAVFREVLGR